MTMEKKICIDCEDFPVCMLQGRFADDPVCEYYKPEKEEVNKDD